MRIEIEVSQETLATVMDGRCVEGRLRLQLSSMGTHHVIGFGPYNRKPRVRVRDRLIRRLEHGWVKESVERIKVYESIPKEIGTPRILAVIDRETKEAKEALMEHELDMLEFC
jgi:hypothetical protein